MYTSIRDKNIIYNTLVKRPRPVSNALGIDRKGVMDRHATFEREKWARHFRFFWVFGFGLFLFFFLSVSYPDLGAGLAEQI